MIVKFLTIIRGEKRIMNREEVESGQGNWVKILKFYGRRFIIKLYMIILTKFAFRKLNWPCGQFVARI